MMGHFTLERIKPRRKRQNRPEQDLQRQLVRALGYLLPKGCYFFAVPNGGQRSPIEAAIMAGCGVKAGVPDLVFIYQGKVFGIELKASNGSLTPAQRAVHVEFREAGSRVEIARSIPEALNHLRSFGIPLRDTPLALVFKEAA